MFNYKFQTIKSFVLTYLDKVYQQLVIISVSFVHYYLKPIAIYIFLC